MSDYGSDSYFFARQQGGGGTAPSGGGATPVRTPSGGAGGGSPLRITPGSAAPAVSRPQKTDVLTHAQQTSIGGPGAPSPPPPSIAPPHPGMPSGGLGPSQDIPGGIGEHQRVGPGGDISRSPSQRDERGHPDQFRQFDPRFDHDRDRLHNDYWRTGMSDYDRDRFRPWIGEDRLLWHIFGLQYYPEFITYAVPYYPVDCGTWVIGADGRWYRVDSTQLALINRIERVRGIGRYTPIVIPCGWGYI